MRRTRYAAERSDAERTDRLVASVHAKEASRTRGFVYFVACGQYLKIGYSHDPRDRVRRMATNNPYDCELVGLLVGGTDLEGEIHGRFRHLHFRNEWFHLTDELLSAVSALCGDWRGLATGAIKSLTHERLEQIGW